jgi:nucleotide-binding universal stress UspA family protein
MKEAALRHVPLTALAVHQALVGWTGHGTAGYPEDAGLVEQTKAAAQEQVDKVLAALGGPRPEMVTVQAVDGIPAEALLNAAADADMVVVGARGAGGFARLRVGSVADVVAHHAQCPVVIVPHDR